MPSLKILYDGHHILNKALNAPNSSFISWCLQTIPYLAPVQVSDIHDIHVGTKYNVHHIGVL